MKNERYCENCEINRTPLNLNQFVTKYFIHHNISPDKVKIHIEVEHCSYKNDQEKIQWNHIQKMGASVNFITKIT